MPGDGKPRENPALLDDRIPSDPLRPKDSARLAEDAPVSDRRRASDETNVHDAGSGANDTIDGLSEEEEAVRRAAEDVPTGQSLTGPTEAIPVFDRRSMPPKV
jgi:hypothetical protein